MPETPLLSIRDLDVQFDLPRKGLFGKSTVLKAVRGVSFDVGRGRTLGIVGESGSGKTTLALALMRLVPIASGSIMLGGDDLAQLGPKQLRDARRRIQMIFQDPQSSLNPRLRVRDIIREPLDILGLDTMASRNERVDELLEAVGLVPEMGSRFPHQFSGGQRQRIGIARALSTRPEVIVCDEPVSALDVAVQAQILNLLSDLQKSYGLTFVFISHDLGVIQHIADDIAVMYLGRIVEYAGRKSFFNAPRHPYSKALLAAAPTMERLTIGDHIPTGEPPSPFAVAAGCSFAGRCPSVQPKCLKFAPELMPIGDGHAVSCHFPN
jgi:peptide/nickel transport system ATP-binding protein